MLVMPRDRRAERRRARMRRLGLGLGGLGLAVVYWAVVSGIWRAMVAW